MKLFLLRHGAVEPPRPGVFYGGTEVPLSGLGRDEARQAAAQLEGAAIHRLVASPLSRANYGAECVRAGRPGLALETEESLREISRGRWVGLTPEEIRESYPGDLESHEQDPEHWRGHGGESLGDLRDRVLACHDRLVGESAGRTMAIVAHLFPLRSILADALGFGLQRWNEIRLPTGSVSALELRDGSPQVLWVGRKLEAGAAARALRPSEGP